MRRRSLDQVAPVPSQNLFRRQLSELRQAGFVTRSLGELHAAVPAPNQPVVLISRERFVYGEHVVDVSFSADTNEPYFRFIDAKM